MLIGGNDISYDVVHVFFHVCLHSRDWWKSDSSVDREPQGIGGGIQIPET